MPEAQRRPGQAGEHQVQHRLRGARRELADERRHRDARDGLGPEPATRPGPVAVEERERQRHRDEGPAEVAEQPRPPHGRDLGRIDHAAESQRARADGGARHGRGEQRHHHAGQVRDRPERRAVADQTGAARSPRPAPRARCPRSGRAPRRAEASSSRSRSGRRSGRPARTAARRCTAPPSRRRTGTRRSPRPVRRTRTGSRSARRRSSRPRAPATPTDVLDVRDLDPGGSTRSTSSACSLNRAPPFARAAPRRPALVAARWRAGDLAIGCAPRSRRPARSNMDPSRGFGTDDTVRASRPYKLDGQHIRVRRAAMTEPRHTGGRPRGWVVHTHQAGSRPITHDG